MKLKYWIFFYAVPKLLSTDRLVAGCHSSGEANTDCKGWKAVKEFQDSLTVDELTSFFVKRGEF